MGDTGKNIIAGLVSITLAGVGVVMVYQVLTHGNAATKVINAGGSQYSNFFGTLMKG